MPLDITYACNWCNKTHKMMKVETPPDWIEHPVHNPGTRDVETGFFCQEECKTHWDKFEDSAIKSAEEHYKKEFYSYMNKMKADVAQRPKLAAK